MHRLLSLKRRRRLRGERGVAALMVSVAVVGLLIASAMVLDFGLVRIDRQVAKSSADSATLAGLNGLNSGDGKAHPFRGVCTAIQYLQQNDRRFNGVTDASGTWAKGDGTAISGFDCTTPSTLLSSKCVPGSPASWATFSWTGTFQGAPLKVQIQSGYQLAGSGWSEESLTAVAADSADNAQGCNQLAVIITENRKPGLGSLAHAADLVTSVRTVGRVKLGGGGYAPAMLLLKRTGCTSLEVGSTAGSSWVKVYGTVSTNNISQPGTIHADADGSSCSTNVFYGKANDGIIAYAAPLVGNPTQPDPSKPGSITSLAQLNGITSYDGSSKVYASSALNGTGGTHITPTGLELVTRKPVDDRYLSGVNSAMSGANSVFTTINSAAAATANSWQVVSCDGSGTVSSLPTPAPTATSRLYVDCGNLKALPTTNAGTVLVSGTVSPSATISLPAAHHVYIGGSGDAINLGTGNTFSMHTTGNLSGSLCSDATTDPVDSKAVLFIRNGDIKQNGGLLQLCYTTVYMMGGQPDGCAPTAGYATASPPTQTPCGGTKGTGQIKQTGGGVDWTAPNRYDVMTLSNGDPDPARAPAWIDPNGQEDLALWDESAGNDSSDKYQFTGGGSFHLRGIFMVPNADPVSLSGTANFVFQNAQFVATSLALASNNTTLSMTVDPNSAVTLPRLKTVGLVR